MEIVTDPLTKFQKDSTSSVPLVHNFQETSDIDFVEMTNDIRLLQVRYGAINHEIQLEKDDQTVNDLLKKLEVLTALPRDHMKLIAQGKVLALSMELSQLKTTKLLLMGSVGGNIEAPVEMPRIRDDLTVEGRNYRRKYAVDARALVQREFLQTNYKFHDIQTLPNLPNPQKSHEILSSLAHDPAILHVLSKHKWSVGILCELYPEGYVGVSDVCVMGLNENHGQKIHLRLRTDDLSGFRKILSIRKVLYHELAHNVHSDHDDDFYRLMREIEKEVNDYNGSGLGGRGRRLGKGREIARSTDQYHFQGEEDRGDGLLPQKVYKLGDGAVSQDETKSAGEMVREKILERERERQRVTMEVEGNEGEDSEESDDEEEIICSGGCGHPPLSVPGDSKKDPEPSPSTLLDLTLSSTLPEEAPDQRANDIAVAVPATGTDETQEDVKLFGGQDLVGVVQAAVDCMLLDYLFSTDLAGNAIAAMDDSSSLFNLLPEPVQRLRQAAYALATTLSPNSFRSVLLMTKDVLKRIQVRYPYPPPL
jgi:hypothetical protein